MAQKWRKKWDLGSFSFSIFGPCFFSISGRGPFSIFRPIFSHFRVSARFPFYTRRPDSQFLTVLLLLHVLFCICRLVAHAHTYGSLWSNMQSFMVNNEFWPIIRKGEKGGNVPMFADFLGKDFPPHDVGKHSNPRDGARRIRQPKKTKKL